MADQLTVLNPNWPQEEIPKGSIFFYRVPKGWLRPDKALHPFVFRENAGSMSVDWDRYSTATETRSRRGRPERFAVVQLPSDSVDKIRLLTSKHEPMFRPDLDPPDINRSHCAIYGIEVPPGVSELGYKERVQLELYEAAGKTWIIPPDSPT